MISISIFLNSDPLFQKCLNSDKKSLNPFESANPFDDEQNEDVETNIMSHSVEGVLSLNTSENDEPQHHQYEQRKTHTLPMPPKNKKFSPRDKSPNQRLKLNLKQTSSPRDSSDRPLYHGTPPTTPEEEKTAVLKSVEQNMQKVSVDSQSNSR